MRKILNLLCVFAFILMSHHTMAQDKSVSYEKVEVEASFPGGQAAWNKYITGQLLSHVNEFRKKDIGTCNIQFIVDFHRREKRRAGTQHEKDNYYFSLRRV
jgi:hypothetical protein